MISNYAYKTNTFKPIRVSSAGPAKVFPLLLSCIFFWTFDLNIFPYHYMSPVSDAMVYTLFLNKKNMCLFTSNKKKVHHNTVHVFVKSIKEYNPTVSKRRHFYS